MSLCAHSLHARKRLAVHASARVVRRGVFLSLPQAERKPPEAILALRVVDPAMGSGHFLVGATRRLAEHLLDAYRRRLDEAQAAFPDAMPDDLSLAADIPDEVMRAWDNEEGEDDPRFVTAYPLSRRRE